MVSLRVVVLLEALRLSTACVRDDAGAEVLAADKAIWDCRSEDEGEETDGELELGPSEAAARQQVRGHGPGPLTWGVFRGRDTAGAIHGAAERYH